jgi:hypothetical protein
LHARGIGTLVEPKSCIAEEWQTSWQRCQATIVTSCGLEVRRVVDGAYLWLCFDTLKLTNGASFETGVNLILSGRERANCAKEDGIVPSQKQR